MNGNANEAGTIDIGAFEYHICLDGNQDCFTVPELEIIDFTDLTSNSILINSNITNNGGTEILEKGVVYSLTENPTLTKNKTLSNSSDLEFTTELSNLLNSTKYYARAFATNSEGTTYSNQIEFTTFAPLPTIQSKSITFHSITKNRIGLRWTKGNGSKRVALASMGILNNAEYLLDGNGYTAGNFGVNTLPNNSNVSVVYNGDNTTCLVDGLARNTTYYFRIMEYNGSGASANYLQTSASGNPSSKKTNKKESEEEISSSLINVYPNPVNDVLNIEFNKDFNNVIDNAKLTIINEVGQEVFSTTNTNNLLTINTLDFVNGVYHIIITNDEESIYHSFVIER
jgi:hypothetical protein